MKCRNCYLIIVLQKFLLHVWPTSTYFLDYVFMIDLYNNPMKSAGSKDYFSFFALLYVIAKKTAILFKVFMTFSLKFSSWSYKILFKKLGKVETLNLNLAKCHNDHHHLFGTQKQWRNFEVDQMPSIANLILKIMATF